MATAYKEVVSQSDRESWMVARHNGWGASESYPLLKDGKGRRTLILNKALGVQPDLDHIPQIQRGLLLEEYVLWRYGKERGLEGFGPCGKMLSHQYYPHLFATPDGWQILDGQDSIIEIKCLDSIDRFSTNKRKHQVQHQLLVTGYKTGTLVAIGLGKNYTMLDEFCSPEEVVSIVDSSPIRWLDIKADDELHKQVIEKAGTAWTEVTKIRDMVHKGKLFQETDIRPLLCTQTTSPSRPTLSNH